MPGFDAMHAPAGDIMKNYRPLVAPQLEAGVRIMIYAGVGEFTVSAAGVKCMQPKR